MESAPLEVLRRGAIVEIVIPGGLLSDMTARALAEEVSAAADDGDLRVLVLRSASSDFCLGPGPDLDPVSVRPSPSEMLAGLSIPVIAVMTGAVLSVGLEVALAADLRVSHVSARFGLPDLQHGRLPSWGGTQRLPRIVGRSMAVRMLMLREEVSGDEALTSGLVHALSADPSVQVQSWCESLVYSAPAAVALAKEALKRGSELPMRHALEYEGDLNHLLQTTQDRAEGLTAFFEKRSPNFQGR